MAEPCVCDREDMENELFYLDKTQMLFGDAKTVLGGVIDELSKLPSKEVATA